MSAKPETLNLNSPYIKMIVGAFVIGGAWYRLEYKMDQQSERIVKKIDEHIIADKFEKQIMQTEIATLREQLAKTTEYMEVYAQKEFLRPSDTRVETKKRKQF